MEAPQQQQQQQQQHQHQPALLPSAIPVAEATTTTTPAAAVAAASSPQQHQDSHKPTRKERRHLAPSHSKDTGAHCEPHSTAGSQQLAPPGPPAPALQGPSSMAYQQKHALHRLKRLKKRAPHRDLVISFVPRLRTSIINRLDFFHRYSKQEQEVLSCFDFLDELLVNFCDGGESSPRYSHKLYQSMIYQLI